MIDRDEAITDEMVEAMAAVIWNWRWEFEHKSGSRPYPYERLIEPTKDDLRELARMDLKKSHQSPPAKQPRGSARGGRLK